MIRGSVFLLCVFFSTTLARYVDELPKCALKDQECFRKLYQDIVVTIGEKGIPDLNIPVVDPIELRNITVSILGLLDITMVEGVATGVKNCVFEKFSFDLIKENGYQEHTCSIKTEGKYMLSSNSPLVNHFLGNGSIHGEGNGKVSIDKVHLTYDFPVYAQKRSNGEIYMNCDYENINYTFEVQGGAEIFADNINLGYVEVSKEIIPLINDNWKFFMSKFGKPFFDKAMEIYFDFAGKFFNAVPARYYIIDDLAPFARP